MSPYEERVFWLGKFQARQDVCSWFRDFEGRIVICQISEEPYFAKSAKSQISEEPHEP
jgi:hypothetical protein